ncbi:hypothetical protein Tco_0741864 [Tanacetum coccineum]
MYVCCWNDVDPEGYVQQVIRAGPHTVSAGCFVRSCWLHMITTGRCLMVLTGRLTVIAAYTLQFVLIG